MDKGETQTNGTKDKDIDDYAQGFILKGWHRTICIKKRRGFTNIVYCIDESIQELKRCIKKSKERLITAVNNSNDYIRTNIKAIKQMERETIVWILQVTNCKERVWISVNSSTK